MTHQIKPIHQHDCLRCRFITATYNDTGQTYDWYICGEKDPSIIGRYGNEGSQYWSMPVSVLEANLNKPSYIMNQEQYAWSERMQIAYLVFSWWRTDYHLI